MRSVGRFILSNKNIVSKSDNSTRPENYFREIIFFYIIHSLNRKNIEKVPIKIKVAP